MARTADEVERDELAIGARGMERKNGPGQVVRLRIADLCAIESPRLNGLDHDHARLLAEISGQLPPILVHRDTMSVIDGMHRLQAARINGDEYINACLFQGSREEVFLLAVRENIAHGLPLTLADRRAAAKRIVRSNPYMSDRSIGHLVGLAARTVAKIRRGLEEAVTPKRVGRDGRARPVNATEGRRRASAIMTARPSSSLRQVAREAGVSVGTVRDVRARMAIGDDPVPLRQRTAPPGESALRPVHSDATMVDVSVIIDGLRRDPSIRYTESGRDLLRWLGPRIITPEQWQDRITQLPPHCAMQIAKIARGCATAWAGLADELDEWISDCA